MWPLVVVLSSAQFILVLDGSVVTVALPDIQRAFSFSQPTLQWVVNGFALPFGALMLLGGRVADLYGRRNAFLVSVMAFVLSSLAAGLAASGAMLVAMRVAQGCAGALMAPAALGLLTANFPPGHQRNQVLAFNGAALSGGFVAGVVTGGVVAAFLGWRAVFFINVPIGICVVLAAKRVLPFEAHRPSDRRLDLRGALLVTSALFVLVYAITGVGSLGRVSPGTVVMLAVSCALFSVFLLSQFRAESSLIPRSLLSERSVLTGSIVMLLAAASTGGLIFALTLYLQEVEGLGPLAAGLVLVGPGAGAMVGGAGAARGISRLGQRGTLVTGLVLQLLGAAALARMGQRGDLAVIVCAGALNGLGYVSALVAASVIVTRPAGEADHGSAAGLVNAAMEIGAGLGVAIAAAVGSTANTALGSDRFAGGSIQIASGLQRAMFAATAVAVVAALASLLIPRPSAGRQHG
jgi:EmrB/QacA subfamily drug resistance transporter